MIKMEIILKKKILTIIGCALLSSVTFSYADSNYNCKKKEQNLQKQLQYAEQYNNTYRIEGLKRALANVRQYCGQQNSGKDGYIADFSEQEQALLYKQKLDKKVLKYQKKVLDAKYDLEQAKLSGKSDKINKRVLKLEEQQQKLNYYINELNKY